VDSKQAVDSERAVDSEQTVRSASVSSDTNQTDQAGGAEQESEQGAHLPNPSGQDSESAKDDQAATDDAVADFEKGAGEVANSGGVKQVIATVCIYNLYQWAPYGCSADYDSGTNLRGVTKTLKQASSPIKTSSQRPSLNPERSSAA